MFQFPSPLDETDRVESRLGDLFRRKGFVVVHSYQPDLVNGKDPGEVDLLCYMDNHLLVLEVKSTYIRKTKQGKRFSNYTLSTTPTQNVNYTSKLNQTDL